MSKLQIYDDEPIQWHLPTTKHDRSPCCGVLGMGNMGRRKRCCMADDCSRVWDLPVSTTLWKRIKDGAATEQEQAKYDAAFKVHNGKMQQLRGPA